MGLFGFGKKKKEQQETAEERLIANEGIEFTTEIPEEIRGTTRTYLFTDVTGTITGDTAGLRPGAIVYLRREGKILNCIKKEIGVIDNPKICQMVTDYFDQMKEGFGHVIRAKLLYVDDRIHINIGFYRGEFEEEEK